jgi:hypothetical protein
MHGGVCVCGRGGSSLSLLRDRGQHLGEQDRDDRRRHRLHAGRLRTQGPLRGPARGPGRGGQGAAPAAPGMPHPQPTPRRAATIREFSRLGRGFCPASVWHASWASSWASSSASSVLVVAAPPAYLSSPSSATDDGLSAGCTRVADPRRAAVAGTGGAQAGAPLQGASEGASGVHLGWPARH